MEQTSLKSKLTVAELDFLLDILMSVRDPKINHSAGSYGVNTRTVVKKLGALADLAEGIHNDFNN